jgi:hypothetical protein
MSSLYKALNEEEAAKARFDLLDDGEYDGVVKVSTARMSNSGNMMADMYVAVYDSEGNSHDVRDFLIFTPKMIWKTKHFCDSSGLEKEYAEEKFVPEMAANKRVRVKISRKIGTEIPVEKLKGKPFGSKYPDQNAIDDYLPRVAGEKPLPDKRNDFINDDIPF